MKDTIKAGILVVGCVLALIVGIYISETWLVPRFTNAPPASSHIDQPAPTPATKPQRVIRENYGPPPAQAAPQRMVYRWKDTEGTWHLSDTEPPPDATEVTSRPLR